jgi:large repetitive protein
MLSSSPRRIFFALLLALVTTVLTAQQAHASHLRGVTLSWAPTGNAREVEFTLTYSQRYTFDPTRVVLGQTISQPIVFGDTGPAPSGTATGPVTSINTTDDYYIAVLKIRHTYAGAGPYTAYYSSSARISTVKNGADGIIRMETVVLPASGNSSPVTILSPVVGITFPAGITSSGNTVVTFPVTASDADGDTLRYRLATSAESGVGQPAGLSINSTSGVVSWNLSSTIAVAGRAPLTGDLWTTQIIVEDYDASNNLKSKAPVDVILNLTQASGSPPSLSINPAGPLTVSSNQPATFTVTGTDPDAAARVTLNGNGLPTGATMSPALGATLSPPVTSTFSWTPTLTQAGAAGQTYVINFTATDDTNQQVSKSIMINVLPAGAPTALSQSVTAAGGVTKTVTLSATDPNGSNLTFSVTGNPAQGVLSNLGPPSCGSINGVWSCSAPLTYTADGAYAGPDSFSFRASNGVQNSNAATVSVNVTPGNRPPVAQSQSVTTNADAPVSFTLGATDPDGNPLTFAATSPAHGALSGVAPNLTYTPAAGFAGSDSFTFKANDGAADSNVATVSITVTAPSCLSPMSGLVAWYPGQGNANDIVGNVTGTPTGGVAFSAGHVGQAFDFNGSGYYSIPSTNVPVGNAPRTVQFWVSPHATVPDHEIFYYGAANTNQAFGVDVDGTTQSGNVRLQFYTYGEDINAVDTGVKPDRFMHVAFTYDGGTLKAYVNGVLKAALPVSAPLDTPPSVVTLGHFSSNNFDGKLDEVQIYNRALSGSEVQSLYTASSAGTCRPPATTTTVTSLSAPFSASPQSLTLNASVASSAPVNSGSVQFTVKTGGGATVGSPVTAPVSGGAAGAAFTLPGGTTAQALNVTASYTTPALDFQSSLGTGTLTVTKATPTINWATPADITYGTPLGNSQLNATADVPGTFTYTPAAVTVLNAGNGQTLSASFTPADAANYNSATKTVSINVNKADSETTVSVADAVYDGMPHGGAAAVTGAGGLSQTLVVTYAGRNGTNYAASQTPPTNAGLYTASAGFDGDAKHNGSSDSKSITITQAAATINVNGHTGVYNGQPHGATGTAAGVGGENLNGLLNLGASFTDFPGGTAHWTFAGNINYAPSSGDAAITINKADQAINWNDPASIVYGATLGSAQLNSTVSVVGPAPAGALTYSPASGTLPHAGAHQPLTVSVAATNNYNAASRTVHIDVAKAAPVINWSNPAAITYGVALSAIQLNATAAHPSDGGPLSATTLNGTFAYSPTAGTLLPVGNNTLSVVFTPTNAGDYTTAAKSVVERVNYRVCTLYDQTKAAKSGSTIPVKLQLCSASGANLSAQRLVVTAIGTQLVSSNAWGAVEDAGNANPDMNFRFMMFDPATPGYIFNLKTTGLATGVYQLGFHAGSDPTVYIVQFQIK